jgi:hypothetical protein
MIENYLSVQQVWFTNRPRHWSPMCEAYTGADSLITALRNGWRVRPTVYRQDVLHGGSRRTSIYTFTLQSGTEVRNMAVICTPFIVRFLAEQRFMVLQVEDGEVVDEAEEPILGRAQMGA